MRSPEPSGRRHNETQCIFPSMTTHHVVHTESLHLRVPIDSAASTAANRHLRRETVERAPLRFQKLDGLVV